MESTQNGHFLEPFNYDPDLFNLPVPFYMVDIKRFCQKRKTELDHEVPTENENVVDTAFPPQLIEDRAGLPSAYQSGISLTATEAESTSSQIPHCVDNHALVSVSGAANCFPASTATDAIEIHEQFTSSSMCGQHFGWANALNFGSQWYVGGRVPATVNASPVEMLTKCSLTDATTCCSDEQKLVESSNNFGDNVSVDRTPIPPESVMSVAATTTFFLNKSPPLSADMSVSAKHSHVELTFKLPASKSSERVDLSPVRESVSSSKLSLDTGHQCQSSLECVTTAADSKIHQSYAESEITLSQQLLIPLEDVPSVNGSPSMEIKCEPLCKCSFGWNAQAPCSLQSSYDMDSEPFKSPSSAVPSERSCPAKIDIEKPIVSKLATNGSSAPLYQRKAASEACSYYSQAAPSHFVRLPTTTNSDSTAHPDGLAFQNLDYSTRYSNRLNNILSTTQGNSHMSSPSRDGQGWYSGAPNVNGGGQIFGRPQLFYHCNLPNDNWRWLQACTDRGDHFSGQSLARQCENDRPVVKKQYLMSECDNNQAFTARLAAPPRHERPHNISTNCHIYSLSYPPRHQPQRGLSNQHPRQYHTDIPHLLVNTDYVIPKQIPTHRPITSSDADSHHNLYHPHHDISVFATNTHRDYSHHCPPSKQVAREDSAFGCREEVSRKMTHGQVQVGEGTWEGHRSQNDRTEGHGLIRRWDRNYCRHDSVDHWIDGTTSVANQRCRDKTQTNSVVRSESACRSNCISESSSSSSASITWTVSTSCTCFDAWQRSCRSRRPPGQSLVSLVRLDLRLWNRCQSFFVHRLGTLDRPHLRLTDTAGDTASKNQICTDQRLLEIDTDSITSSLSEPVKTWADSEQDTGLLQEMMAQLPQENSDYLSGGHTLSTFGKTHRSDGNAYNSLLNTSLTRDIPPRQRSHAISEQARGRNGPMRAVHDLLGQDNDREIEAINQWAAQSIPQSCARRSRSAVQENHGKVTDDTDPRACSTDVPDDTEINEPIRPRSSSRRRAYIIKRPQSVPHFGRITPRPFTPDQTSDTDTHLVHGEVDGSGLQPGMGQRDVTVEQADGYMEEGEHRGEDQVVPVYATVNKSKNPSLGERQSEWNAYQHIVQDDNLCAIEEERWTDRREQIGTFYTETIVFPSRRPQLLTGQAGNVGQSTHGKMVGGSQADRTKDEDNFPSADGQPGTVTQTEMSQDVNYDIFICSDINTSTARGDTNYQNQPLKREPPITSSAIVVSSELDQSISICHSRLNQPQLSEKTPHSAFGNPIKAASTLSGVLKNDETTIENMELEILPSGFNNDEEPFVNQSRDEHENIQGEGRRTPNSDILSGAELVGDKPIDVESLSEGHVEVGSDGQVFIPRLHLDSVGEEDAKKKRRSSWDGDGDDFSDTSSEENYVNTVVKRTCGLDYAVPAGLTERRDGNEWQSSATSIMVVDGQSWKRTSPVKDSPSEESFSDKLIADQLSVQIKKFDSSVTRELSERPQADTDHDIQQPVIAAVAADTPLSPIEGNSQKLPSILAASTPQTSTSRPYGHHSGEISSPLASLDVTNGQTSGTGTGDRFIADGSGLLLGASGDIMGTADPTCAGPSPHGALDDFCATDDPDTSDDHLDDSSDADDDDINMVGRCGSYNVSGAEIFQTSYPKQEIDFSKRLTKKGISEPLPGDPDGEEVVKVKKRHNPFKRLFSRKKGKYSPSADLDTANSVLPQFTPAPEPAKKKKSSSPKLFKKKSKDKSKQKVAAHHDGDKDQVTVSKSNSQQMAKPKKTGKLSKENIVVIKSSGKSLTDLVSMSQTEFQDHGPAGDTERNATDRGGGQASSSAHSEGHELNLDTQAVKFPDSVYANVHLASEKVDADDTGNCGLISDSELQLSTADQSQNRGDDRGPEIPASFDDGDVCEPETETITGPGCEDESDEIYVNTQDLHQCHDLTSGLRGNTLSRSLNSTDHVDNDGNDSPTGHTDNTHKESHLGDAHADMSGDKSILTSGQGADTEISTSSETNRHDSPDSSPVADQSVMVSSHISVKEPETPNKISLGEEERQQPSSPAKDWDATCGSSVAHISHQTSSHVGAPRAPFHAPVDSDAETDGSEQLSDQHNMVNDMLEHGPSPRADHQLPQKANSKQNLQQSETTKNVDVSLPSHMPGDANDRRLHGQAETKVTKHMTPALIADGCSDFSDTSPEVRYRQTDRQGNELPEFDSRHSSITGDSSADQSDTDTKTDATDDTGKKTNIAETDQGFLICDTTGVLEKPFMPPVALGGEVENGQPKTEASPTASARSSVSESQVRLAVDIVGSGVCEKQMEKTEADVGDDDCFNVEEEAISDNVFYDDGTSEVGRGTLCGSEIGSGLPIPGVSTGNIRLTDAAPVAQCQGQIGGNESREKGDVPGGSSTAGPLNSKGSFLGSQYQDKNDSVDHINENSHKPHLSLPRYADEKKKAMLAGGTKEQSHATPRTSKQTDHGTTSCPDSPIIASAKKPANHMPLPKLHAVFCKLDRRFPNEKSDTGTRVPPKTKPKPASWKMKAMLRKFDSSSSSDKSPSPTKSGRPKFDSQPSRENINKDLLQEAMKELDDFIDDDFEDEDDADESKVRSANRDKERGRAVMDGNNLVEVEEDVIMPRAKKLDNHVNGVMHHLKTWEKDSDRYYEERHEKDLDKGVKQMDIGQKDSPSGISYTSDSQAVLEKSPDSATNSFFQFGTITPTKDTFVASAAPDLKTDSDDPLLKTGVTQFDAQKVWPPEKPDDISLTSEGSKYELESSKDELHSPSTQIQMRGAKTRHVPVVPQISDVSSSQADRESRKYEDVVDWDQHDNLVAESSRLDLQAPSLPYRPPDTRPRSKSTASPAEHLQQGYEDVVDKLTDSGDKANDLNISKKTKRRGSSPTTKKFHFPWKRKDKDSSGKKVDTDCSKQERQKDSGKDKEKKTKKGKEEKEKKSKTQTSEKVKLPGSKSGKLSKENRQKSKAGKLASSSSHGKEVYHEIEDSIVAGGKIIQAKKSPSKSTESLSSSSSSYSEESDYEPVNYVEGDSDNEKPEGVKVREETMKSKDRIASADSCGYEIPAKSALTLASRDVALETSGTVVTETVLDKDRGQMVTGSSDSVKTQDRQPQKVEGLHANKPQLENDNEEAITPYLTFQYPRYLDNGEIYVDSPIVPTNAKNKQNRQKSGRETEKPRVAIESSDMLEKLKTSVSRDTPERVTDKETEKMLTSDKLETVPLGVFDSSEPGLSENRALTRVGDTRGLVVQGETTEDIQPPLSPESLSPQLKNELSLTEEFSLAFPDLGLGVRSQESLEQREEHDPSDQSGDSSLSPGINIPLNVHSEKSKSNDMVPESDNNILHPPDSLDSQETSDIQTGDANLLNTSPADVVDGRVEDTGHTINAKSRYPRDSDRIEDTSQSWPNLSQPVQYSLTTPHDIRTEETTYSIAMTEDGASLKKPSSSASSSSSSSSEDEVSENSRSKTTGKFPWIGNTKGKTKAKATSKTNESSTEKPDKRKWPWMRKGGAGKKSGQSECESNKALENNTTSQTKIGENLEVGSSAHMEMCPDGSEMGVGELVADPKSLADRGERPDYPDIAGNNRQGDSFFADQSECQLQKPGQDQNQLQLEIEEAEVVMRQSEHLPVYAQVRKSSLPKRSSLDIISDKPWPGRAIENRAMSLIESGRGSSLDLPPTPPYMSSAAAKNVDISQGPDLFSETTSFTHKSPPLARGNSVLTDQSDEKEKSDQDTRAVQDTADSVFQIPAVPSPSELTNDPWKDYSPLVIGSLTTRMTSPESESDAERAQTPPAKDSRSRQKPPVASRSRSLPTVPPIPVLKVRKSLQQNSSVSLPLSLPDSHPGCITEDTSLGEPHDVNDHIYVDAFSETPDEDELYTDATSSPHIRPKTRKGKIAVDFMGKEQDSVVIPSKQKPQKPERKRINQKSGRTSDSEENGQDIFSEQGDHDSESPEAEYDQLPVRARRISNSLLPSLLPGSQQGMVADKTLSRLNTYTPVVKPVKGDHFVLSDRNKGEYSAPWEEKKLESLTPTLPPRQYNRSESGQSQRDPMGGSCLSLSSDGADQEMAVEVSPRLRKAVSLGYDLDKDSEEKKAESGKKSKQQQNPESVKKAISLRSLTSLFHRHKKDKSHQADSNSVTDDNTRPPQADAPGTSSETNRQTSGKSGKPKKSNQSEKPPKPAKPEKTKKPQKSTKIERRRSSDDIEKPGTSGQLSKPIILNQHPGAALKGRPLCRLLKVNEDETRVVELVRPHDEPLGVFFTKGSDDTEEGLFVNAFLDKSNTKLFAGILCIGDQILEIDGCDIRHMTLEQVKVIIQQKERMIVKILPVEVQISNL